jgi:hypothetical protein
LSGTRNILQEGKDGGEGCERPAFTPPADSTLRFRLHGRAACCCTHPADSRRRYFLDDDGWDHQIFSPYDMTRASGADSCCWADAFPWYWLRIHPRPRDQPAAISRVAASKAKKSLRSTDMPKQVAGTPRLWDLLACVALIRVRCRHLRWRRGRSFVWRVVSATEKCKQVGELHASSASSAGIRL